MSPQYWLSRRLLRIIFKAAFRWQVWHPERVPAKGPVILAANHASFLDPPLVGSAALREVHYLARKSLFRVPGIGAFLRSVNAVPVERGGVAVSGVRIILERLQSGSAILLFPEGTRTYDGAMLPAQSGIGLVVLKSDAPVVPVRIFGSFEAWSRNMRFPRARPVAVKFGNRLDFTSERTEAANASKAGLKDLYQNVANRIMAAIAEINRGAE